MPNLDEDNSYTTSILPCSGTRDWEKCPAVESVPGRLSGAWVFTNTRVPVSALFGNLAAGATIEEFLDWFEGVAKWQVDAVLEHVAENLDAKVLNRLRTS